MKPASRRIVVALGATAAVACAPRLGAQTGLRSAFALGTASGDPGMRAAPSLYLEPSLVVTQPFVRAAFRLQASPFDRSSGPALFDGAMQTGSFGFGRAHFSIAGRAEATRPGYAGQLYARGGVDLRVNSSAYAAQGLSAGVGLLRATTPSGSATAPSARVGGWLRRLGVTFSAELRSAEMASSGSASISGDSLVPTAPGGFPSDTLNPARAPAVRSVVDTPIVLHPPTVNAGSLPRTLLATEARFTLSSRVAGVDIDAAGGAFLFSSARNAPYGSVTLSRWITPNAAITAGFVQRVLDPVRHSSTRMVMAGIRMAVRGSASLPPVDAFPANIARAFRAERVGDTVRLSLQADGAQAVELQGDATDWEPVAMTRESGGRWTVALRVAPGVYHLLVRLDGGLWTPPPGTPRAVDPYEGEVGVVVVV